MKHIVLLIVFVCGCGGVFYIEIEPEPVLVKPGRYDVIFEAQEGGDCNILPAYEEQIWVIHESEDGYLWLRVEGLILKSYDKSIFRGEEDGISATAIAGGTEDGFTGTVILNIDFGILYSCKDFADFDGTLVE